MTPPTIIRRIQNPDGSVSILRTTMNTNQQIVRQSPQQQQVSSNKKFYLKKHIINSSPFPPNPLIGIFLSFIYFYPLINIQLFTYIFIGNSTWYEKGFHFQRWQNNRCTARSTAQSCWWCKSKHYQDIPSVRGWWGAKPSGHAHNSGTTTYPSDTKSTTKSPNCSLS